MLINQLLEIPTTSSDDAIFELRMLLSMTLKCEDEDKLRERLKILNNDNFKFYGWEFVDDKFILTDCTTSKQVLLIEL